MPEGTQERATAVRAALQEITAECGREALSSPATMSNLVKDLLPDDQQIARLLVVAAEQQIPGALQDHVSHGMDVGTATRLVASSFAASTLFAQQACTWVVSELAVALGLGSAADLDAIPLLSSEPVNSRGALEARTIPAPDPVRNAGTLGSPRRGSAPGAPEPPRPAPGESHPARRKGSLLAIVAAVVLAVAVGTVLLLNHHGSPPSAPAALQGTHLESKRISGNGSEVLTLTTIKVSGDVMTVDVAYRNVSSTTKLLYCIGLTNPSIVTITLANGAVLHATSTYCSEHPAAFLAISPGAVRRSYATFTLTSHFSQPFSFHWPYGLPGTVSGITIKLSP